MTDQESNKQKKRLVEYAQLKKVQDDLLQALETITNDDPAGPYGKGPFTGNTRESRRVNGMMINFSTTRGGAPEVNMSVRGLQVEAYEFGRWLEEKTRSRIAELGREMAEI